MAKWSIRRASPASSVVAFLTLIVVACSGTTPEAKPTAPPATNGASTTNVVPTTTSTSVPPQSASLSEPTTSFQRVDAATLQPVGSPVTLPGYLAEETVALPDGRLVLVTFVEHDWKVVVLDVDTGQVESVTDAPVTGGLRPLGYSSALEQVVMIGFMPDIPVLYLFDPATNSFGDEQMFDGGNIGWVHEAALIEGGSQVALYETFGYNDARIGEPPQVRVGDLVTNTLGEPVEVTGVVHGYANLAPDAIHQPDWPYGEVEPAIVFDELAGRLFVVHAGGSGLTTVDLLSGKTTVKVFAEPPSFWARVMSWLIPPAQAKGGEPSATLHAWLGDDRSRLYVTGETSDAWRDGQMRLHTTDTPLGLMVIDTETLELDRVLELPVNIGVSTGDVLALTGTEGTLIWCDELCKPGNNEPEVEGESESSGLILLDPNSLEIRQQLRPGQGFHLQGTLDDWLLVETFGDERWGYETINLITGESGGRLEVSGYDHLIITDRGFFLASQSG